MPTPQKATSTARTARTTSVIIVGTPLSGSGRRVAHALECGGPQDYLGHAAQERQSRQAPAQPVPPGPDLAGLPAHLRRLRRRTGQAALAAVPAPARAGTPGRRTAHTRAHPRLG